MENKWKCWRCDAESSFTYMGYSEQQIQDLIIKDRESKRMAKNLKYEWCSENGQSTKEFLGWVYDRLHRVFGDNLICPHMRRLNDIIDDMPGVIPNKIDKMLINDPELTKKREAFRQALANLGHEEATTYTHWALEAFDKAHGLR